MNIGRSIVKYIFSVLILLFSIKGIAQGLEFGTQDPGQVVSPESMFPFAKLTLILFSIYLICGLSLLTFFILKKRKAWSPPILIKDFPTSAKVAATLTLISYALVHIFAFLEVYLVSKVSFKSTSEYFFYMKLPKLIATSHAHFFGHGTMYFVTSAIFIFSKLSEFWKIMFISLALSAGLLDVGSWWAIKYGGNHYEMFSALAGIMSVVAWGFMTIRIMYEAWWADLFGRTA